MGLFYYQSTVPMIFITHAVCFIGYIVGGLGTKSRNNVTGRFSGLPVTGEVSNCSVDTAPLYMAMVTAMGPSEPGL